MRSICLFAGALMLSWLSLSILIALHESGHGLVARVAGWQVRSITIGIGPAIFRMRFGSLQLKVCVVPLAGCIEIDCSRGCGRGPVVWMTLAGPAANLFLSALIFVLLPGSEFTPRKLAAVILDNGNWIMNLYSAVQVPGRRGIYRWLAALSAGSFWIGAFNLLPIWPLDGGEIAALWLPSSEWFLRTSLSLLLCLEVLGWGLILISR